MSYSLETWKQQINHKFHELGNWLEIRKNQDTPYLLYGLLCGLTLTPLVQAAQTRPEFCWW